MIRYLIDIKNPGGIRLFYSARTARGFAYKTEFDVMTENHTDMQCVYTVTRPETEPKTELWSGRTGRFDAEFFRSRIQTDAAGFFLCGPPSLVKDGIQNLRSLGVPEGSIHSEMW